MGYLSVIMYVNMAGIEGQGPVMPIDRENSDVRMPRRSLEILRLQHQGDGRLHWWQTWRRLSSCGGPSRRFRRATYLGLREPNCS